MTQIASVVNFDQNLAYLTKLTGHWILGSKVGNTANCISLSVMNQKRS